MSVTIRQTFRNAFATAVPVLTPLYNAACDSWQIASEGEFQCGNCERCSFPLRINGIEEQHCSLLFRSGLLRIRSDKGPVWVNDLPVSREAHLSPGDIVSIGPISFEVGQTIRQSELQPASLVIDKSSLEICDVTSGSQQPDLGSLSSASPLTTEAIETASVLVRESVGVASTLLTQIEVQMQALELRERKCHEHAQATEAREAAIRDYERRIEERNEQLTQRSQELEARAAELSEQKLRLDSADAAIRQDTVNRQESQNMEELAAIASERESLLKARDEAIQSLAEMKNQSAALNLKETRLQESENRCEDLIQEREALLTAVSELKSALENARSDLEQASRIQAESAAQAQTLFHLSQRIEDCSNQLTIRDSLLLKTNEELDAVRAQVASLSEERDELSRLIAATSVSRELESDADHETERQLLRELESLREEVNQRESKEHARQSETDSELRDIVAKRDDRICELQAEIDSLVEQVEALLPKTNHDAELAEIDRLRGLNETADEQLRDRDDVIRELRARLLQPPVPVPANPHDEDRIRNESRELDRRAALLDQRDEELRERCRQIDQSEEDIEIQRRQLLEARQQLEQARAEIQVAVKQHSASAPDLALAESPSNSADIGDHSQRFGGKLPFEVASLSVGSAAEETRTTDDPPAAKDLRFELAGFFGLQKSHDESAARPVVPTQDFIDLSEPAGESQAVAFHFGEDASSFIQSFSADSGPDMTADLPREENSDDFVRDYMEQLLSRSRKSAGNALPEELKPTRSSENKTGAPPDAGRTTSSTEISPPKSPPKVKSYIDQYMSGDFGDLTGDGSISVTPAAVPAEASANPESQNDEPRSPRAKIDLRKMRENMNSLRTLSTQSAQQALVNHALREERHHVHGRIMLALVLMGMSVFLAVANARGIINHPSLTWLTVIAAFGATIELGRKLYGMKARCKGVLASSEMLDGPCDDSVSEASASVSRHSFTPAVESSETPELSMDSTEFPPHPDLPDRPRTTIFSEAERSSSYFEL